MHPLDTFNDRVWFAWHCLPRGRGGRPPAYAKLERWPDGSQRLSYATLSKIMTGERKTVDAETLVELAAILGVTPQWLQKGDGDAPTPTGPVPSRAEQEKYAAYDPALWAETVAVTGGTSILLPPSADGRFVAPRNNLEIAVHAMYPDVSLEAIRNVAERAAGHENEKPAHHWGVQLRDEELRLRGSKPKAKTRAKAKAKPQQVAPRDQGTTAKRRAG